MNKYVPKSPIFPPQSIGREDADFFLRQLRSDITRPSGDSAAARRTILGSEASAPRNCRDREAWKLGLTHPFQAFQSSPRNAASDVSARGPLRTAPSIFRRSGKRAGGSRLQPPQLDPAYNNVLPRHGAFHRRHRRAIKDDCRRCRSELNPSADTTLMCGHPCGRQGPFGGGSYNRLILLVGVG
jgi:hypothetical protein